MKRILLSALVLFLGLGLIAQTESEVYRLVYIKAKPGQKAEFEEKLAEHNQKFHKEGKMRVQIDAVLTGKHMGKYSWIQGPMKFADLDNWEEDEAHDEHWDKVVMPYIESVEDDGYWRTNPKFMYFPDEMEGDSKTMITYFDLVRGKEKQFYDLFEKVLEVYKQKQYPMAMFLASNQFNNGDGRDVSMVSIFEKIAFLDGQSPFVKDFEEINGSGSWYGFMNDFLESTHSGIDELRISRKDLGGAEE